MKEQVKSYFDQINMSAECEQRIEKALACKSKKKVITWGSYFKIAAACIVLCFLVTDITVYAKTGEGIIRRILSFANNAHFETYTDEQGNEIGSSGSLDLDNAVAPAEYRDGRLYLTINGENKDITDEISDSEAYVFTYTDTEQNTHIMIIGGKPETFGYAEFIKDADDEWCGGYFHGGEVGGTINPEWLENAKEALDIPWK